jgi:2-polyprenyl-6-methoxyphenol hydroxylase-like FAD-dependent oxidoreductase
MPNHPRKIGGGLFPIEDERWVMTLAGFHGDHPPGDPQEFEDFAARIPVPDFQNVIDEHGLVSNEITQYPFPTALRRRYENLERFPDGLMVIGDAIASFNPIYGQGMSVAALEAVQLHHTLKAGSNDNLALEFFERAEPVVDDAWTLSVGSDFQHPETTGPKPTGTDLVNRYIVRLLRKGREDGDLTEAFGRVVIMERRPTSLFRPGVLWRVLKPGG